MLTALRQGGFLHTVRGPWGGFLLARPLSRSGSSMLRPALRAKPHFHAKERHDLGATGSEARPVEAGCADVLHLMIAETCKRRPVSGALAPVARFTAGISRSTWSGVWGFTIHLSGAWQARRTITALVRDARGLTSSVVIAARVMQLGGSTIVGFVVAYCYCGYGVMSAPHHRVHSGLTHIERTSVGRTGSGDPWPDSVGGEGWVGSHPFPQFQVTPTGCQRWVSRGSCSRTAAELPRQTIPWRISGFCVPP